ncbi:MAG: hypothetical protein H6546_02615 [Chitinophagales bacterium]|nr:hypothetical protein [Chitinophagales bacterium]
MLNDHPLILSYSSHGESVTFVFPSSFLDVEEMASILHRFIASMGFYPGQLEEQLAYELVGDRKHDKPSVPPVQGLAMFPYMASVRLYGDDYVHIVRFAEKIAQGQAEELVGKFFGKEVEEFSWVVAYGSEDQIQEA